MSSGEEEDDYIIYGNPLDPIDEDNLPRKKAISVEEQFAKDEHGRRRFHGAFTGGFSAGFFNTVGSLEGWTPSSFVSSRSSKAQSKPQSAEDFMDEEDKGEFGIRPMTLKVTAGYENNQVAGSSEKRHRIAHSEGIIPSITPALSEFLKPVRETVGTKLLMKMGWKPGQGIGPRVTKREKQLFKNELNGQRMYGCSLPANSEKAADDEIDESEHEINDITFAPDDYTVHLMNPKKDSFGLGYKGIDRTPVLSCKKDSYSRLSVGGKTIHGQAFGVGAFEEDDDDIYGADDMSQYDFSIAEVASTSTGKSENRSVTCTTANSIDGFHEAKNPPPQKVSFPVVPIPHNFQPYHKAKRSRFDQPQKEPITKRLTSSVQERGVVLSEKDAIPIVEEKSMLFVTQCPAVTNDVIKPHECSRTSSDFKPFERDSEKQLRYEQFLKIKKTGSSEKLNTLQPATMTEWEKERERIEFEKSFKLYRPLATDLADRFTTGKHLDDDNKVLQKEEIDADDPDINVRKQAAKKEMYGILTRRVYKWVPHKRVCHLFNVPLPDGCQELEHSAEATKKNKQKRNIFNFLLSSEAPEHNVRSDIVENVETVKPKQDLEHIVETKLVEEKVQDNILEGKEGVDLFKAIFLSSDEEEESDSKEEKLTRIGSPLNEEKSVFTEIDSSSAKHFTDKNKNLQTRKVDLSPPRGIFENLDLEVLKSGDSGGNFKKMELNIASTNEDNISVAKDFGTNNPEDSASSAGMYGPVLPQDVLCSHLDIKKDIVKKHIFKKRKSGNEDEVWVEKKVKEKKHKKHKKKDKKKDKHKKKKHRH